MGNRLMYGNYEDGNDLSRDGYTTKLEYVADLVSDDNSFEETDGVLTDGSYDIPNTVLVQDSVVNFDFSGLSSFKEGNIITFDFTIAHEQFEGPLSPDVSTGDIDLSFSFQLPRDYANAYELANSDEFKNSVGNNSPRNILPIYDPTPSNDTSCDGYTFTDIFNCSIPNTLADAATVPGYVTKYSSGESGRLSGGSTPWLNNQAIVILSDVTTETIGFKMPYVKFVEDLADPDNQLKYCMEMFRLLSANCSMSTGSARESLHSNRNYEVAVIYTDKFGRQSTALVSDDNTVSIPCRASSLKNNIRVTIPTSQLAPDWATNYRFAIKADQEGYDVIYTKIYTINPDDSMIYFLLDGESAKKVEKGDRLIVKKDSAGVAQSCNYITILEKGSYIADELSPGSLPGTYVKVNPNSLIVSEDANAVVDYGKLSFDQKNGGEYPILGYPMSLGDNTDYDVPSGSVVDISLVFNRSGAGLITDRCEQRKYTLNAKMTATRDYVDMLTFFIGENFQAVLDTGIVEAGLNNIDNVFIEDRYPTTPTPSLGTNYFYWLQGDGVSNPSRLMMTGTRACEGIGKGRDSSIEAHFKVLEIFCFYFLF